MNCDLTNTIPEWIVEYPESLALFESLELDTSCGGRSLEFLLVQQGYSPPDIFAKLEELVNRSTNGGPGD